MDSNKKIIIREIEYWKANKLLPAHYCDFLLNLYSESNPNDSESKATTSRSTLKKTLMMVLSLCTVSLICFLVFYFSEFLSQMQIPLIMSIGGILYVYGIYSYRKNKRNGHYFISLGCAFFFFATIWSISLWNIKELWTKAGILSAAGLFWLMSGHLFKIFYLQFFGLLAIIGTIGWTTYPYFAGSLSWLWIELIWDACFVLLLLLSRFIHKVSARLSINLLIHSIIVYMIPLMQTYFIESVAYETWQALLIAKILIISLILFIGRHQLIKHSSEL